MPHTSKSFPINTVPSKFSPSCYVCKGSHYLSRCEQFLRLSHTDRFVKVKSLGLCLNCLSNKHHVQDCKGSSCRKCARRHHTLLHDSDSLTPTATNDQRRQAEPNSGNRSNPVASTSSTNALVGTVSMSLPQTKQYILYTAVGLVEDENGNSLDCRILLDCGSIHNLVATHVVNALRLRKQTANVSIDGVSGTPQLIKSKVAVRIRSTVNTDFSMNVEFLVMKKVTTDLPIRSFPIDLERIPADVVLVDPMFNRSRRIDMLLGIQVFNELFTGQSFSLADDHTFWCKETCFGWVVGGAVSEQIERSESKNFYGAVTNETLSEQISRFWEMEVFSEPRRLTQEERAAEQSFRETCRRLPDGRYEVGLPTRASVQDLGDSQTMALRRFVQMERRLVHDANLRDQF